MSVDPTQIRIDTSPNQPKALKTPPPAAPDPAVTCGCLSAAFALFLCLVLAVGGGVAVFRPFSTGQFWTEIAEGLEEEYRMATDANASQMDRAMRAGAVAEAYLHAKDEEGYRHWKVISDRHSRAAGIPPIH